MTYMKKTPFIPRSIGAAAMLIMLAVSTTLLLAQTPPEIALWPAGAPGSDGKTAAETVTKSASGELSVSSIHRPSIALYLPPKDKANGTAILVIPGGGHRMLAITHEGYNVAEWLQERGIAAFVLKHRLAREAESTYKIDIESLADTQRALRLIRSRAKEWNIDPGRIGALGSRPAASSYRWPRPAPTPETPRPPTRSIENRRP